MTENIWIEILLSVRRQIDDRGPVHNLVLLTRARREGKDAKYKGFQAQSVAPT